MRQYQFETCAATLEIFKKFNPDIFISTWNKIGNWSWQNAKGYNDEDQYIDYNDIRERYNPVVLDIENYDYYEQAINAYSEKFEQHKVSYVRCNNTLSLHRKIQRAVGLMSEYERFHHFEYDRVILTRPDVVFPESIPDCVFDVVPNQLNAPTNTKNIFNDNFCVADSTTIKKLYANLVYDIDVLWAQGTPYGCHEIMTYLNIRKKIRVVEDPIIPMHVQNTPWGQWMGPNGPFTS